ncbi:DNA primase [Streptomyces sp. NPDC001843]|uniref:DNA primase n=1 Tax=Streptomyces sp. NPDC001843 TaxID=3364617 RepID=UPI00367BDD4C
MNRTALGLAIGAGYVLGRTKKMKMAVAVGSLVAGKKLNLTPRGIADLVNQQLQNNPQFKEIGDQLREDLRGVGKAATSGMAERQMNSLADRLHGRTAQVRDQLSGAVPGTGPEESETAEDAEDTEDTEDTEEADTQQGQDEQEKSGKPAAKKAPAKKAPAKKAAAKTAPAKKAPAKKAPAKKTAKKTQSAAGKPAAKKTAAAGNATRSRQPKGGDEG